MTSSSEKIWPYKATGLPPWLLPLHLPTSRETYEGLMNKHRKFHNDYYKIALKHLRVSLQSIAPVIEAFDPLIQMLLLGDRVNEALDELEKSFKISDTVLQLRMKAALLEHFSGINNLKLCTCFEDILKKDPTCSNSLARLVVMHQRDKPAHHSEIVFIYWELMDGNPLQRSSDVSFSVSL
ncbi:unnamed protein product [Fraxinus pennsylvanica]|uniref:Uncharacterized protein n=1 Tax=Fraxinus pennsylvanica TaxID=56036 RepID=A0AAD1ZUG8_9LAMI|nr:unnamed protein product [Fraxinus pennsylvanica]